MKRLPRDPFKRFFKSSCCGKPIVVCGKPGMSNMKCSKCKKDCLIR